MLQFNLHVLKLLSGWICRPTFLSLDCQSCAVKLLPCLRGCRLEPYSKDSLSCSRYLFSAWILKNISPYRSMSLTLHSQHTKCYASSEESIETPSSTYHLKNAKRIKLTLEFGSTFQRSPTSFSLWKPYPCVPTKSTNFYDGRTPSFPLYI